MPVGERDHDREQSTRTSGWRSIASACKNGGRNDQSSRLRPVGEQQPGGTAEHREQRALCEELKDQASAAGAEREPHGDFLLANRCAREQQICDVRARNQQHERHDDHEHATRDDDVATEPGVDRRLSERHERDAAPLIVVRIGLRQLTRDRLQVRFRLLHADTRLQAARHVERQTAPAVGFHELLQKPARRLLIRHVRHPQRWRADRVGALEAVRHDADDGEIVAVHLDGAPDDRRITAEALLPLAVAEHGDERRAGVLILVRSEAAPDERLSTQDVEVVAGNDFAKDLFGLAFAARYIER